MKRVIVDLGMGIIGRYKKGKDEKGGSNSRELRDGGGGKN